MNKIIFPLFYCATSLAGCSAHDTCITIETAFIGEMKPFAIAGNGKAVIDWGDGSTPQTVMLRELPENVVEVHEKDDWNVHHTYTKAGTKTITISGSITALNIGGAKAITAIDVSRMASLQYLNCSNERLTDINVTRNTMLKALYCSGNQLSNLDISKNTELTILDCDNNHLTGLDISNNTLLMELWCTTNLLSDLDVSKNVALTELRCSVNQLTSLEISSNTALTVLYCHTNQLSSLDASSNTALIELWCSRNNFSALDVSQNTVLMRLYCVENNLSTLDVSQNTMLKWLDCKDNKLSRDALVNIFTALPLRTDDNDGDIFCSDNPGTTELTNSDKAIAAAKNWKVFE